MSEAKNNVVFFNVDYFDNGTVKWGKGQAYPESEDTLRQVALGIAEVVEVDADPEKAEKKLESVRQKLSKLNDLAVEAEKQVAAAKVVEPVATEQFIDDKEFNYSPTVDKQESN